MGLDITLRKVTTEIDYNLYILNNSTLSEFKKYFDEKYFFDYENEYYDFEKVGITEDKYDWVCTEYDEDEIFTYINKTNPLYSLYKRARHTEDGIFIPYITKEECELILKNGWKEYAHEKCFFVSKDFKVDGSHTKLYLFLRQQCVEIFNGKDIPIYKQIDKVIYYDNIGYQRNGMRSKFYDSNPDCYVFTKEKLQFIYDNYVLDDYKEHFKSNILDNHIDGETFVTFDW